MIRRFLMWVGILKPTRDPRLHKEKCSGTKSKEVIQDNNKPFQTEVSRLVNEAPKRWNKIKGRWM